MKGVTAMLPLLELWGLWVGEVFKPEVSKLRLSGVGILLGEGISAASIS